MYMFCQFANLHNFEIALCKLEISKLQTNFERRIWFRNCAVQFRNFGIDGGETACTESIMKLHSAISKFRYRWRKDRMYQWWVQETQTFIIRQRQRFEAFCKGYANGNNKTSKTTSKDKRQKIVWLLKSTPVAVNCSSQLKFWVKKRGFQECAKVAVQFWNF